MHISIIKTSVSVKIGSSHKSLDHQGFKEPSRRSLGLSNLEVLEWNRKLNLWLKEHGDDRPTDFNFGHRFH